MDYETIVYGCNCNQSRKTCYIETSDIGWEKGEVTEIALPIYGGFTLDDGVFISVADFMNNSPNKLVKMVLKDHYGEEVSIQEVLANSKNLEYHEDYILCYFTVDKDLSDLLPPGSYTLFVYLQKLLPNLEIETGKRFIFNKMVTGPDGLEVTIY